MDKVLRKWLLRDRLGLAKMPSEAKSSIVLCENGLNYDHGQFIAVDRNVAARSSEIRK
jgi:hypothetical protein